MSQKSIKFGDEKVKKVVFAKTKSYLRWKT